MKPTDELNCRWQKEKRSTWPSWFEWLQLLGTLSVPIAIGIFSILQNQAQLDQHRVDLEISEAARRNQLVIEERNRRKEEYLADDQHKETIHRDYEGFLGNLLLKEGMSLNVSSAARHIARFRTVSALSQLDPTRRTFLVRSLFEVGLIQLAETENWTRAIVDLRFANLSGIKLGIVDRELNGESSNPLYHNLSFGSTVLRNSSFTGLDISGSNFVQANLKYADLRHSSSGSNLPVWFNTSNLVGASFKHAKKFTASFDNANLTMGILNSFQCYRCSFIETTANDANFDDAQFRAVNDEKSTFYSAHLKRASFFHSLLDQVEFYRTDLHHVNLSHSKCEVYVSDSNMENATLSSTKFIHSVFESTNMIGVYARWTQFRDTTFHTMKMNSIDLVEAVFDNCTLHLADLRECHLEGASFTDSTFISVNFTDCTGFDQTSLGQARSMQNVILPNGTVYNGTGKIDHKE